MLPQRLPVRLAAFLLLTTAAFVGCGREGKIENREAAALEARIARVEAGLTQLRPMTGEAPATLEERMAYFGVPGVAVAVIQDFGVVWVKGYGTADDGGRAMTADTPVQAGTLSQIVSAAVALKLVDAGELSLDAPIGEALRSWPLPDNGLTATTPVTLRQLLSHSSGLSSFLAPGYPPGSVVPTLVQVARGEAPARTPPVEVGAPPGTQAIYSIGGYVAVQQMIEDRTGKPFAAVARAMVLDPLAMEQSTFEQPPPAEMLDRAASGHRLDGALEAGYRIYPEQAAAGLWTTAGDLGRFAQAIVRSLRGGGDTLLSNETAQGLATDQLGATGFGFDLQVRGKTVYLRRIGIGAGFHGVVVLHRDNGYGAVVLANSDAAGRLNEEILRSVAAEYGWENYLNPPSDGTAMTAEALDAFTGRYQLEPDRVLRLEREGNHLLAHETVLEWPDPLYPVGGTSFYRPLFNVTIDFELGVNGRAVSYTFPVGKDQRLERFRLGDGEVRPAELLLDGKIEEAVSAYRKDGISSPQRLNNFGYQLLARRKLAEAQALFELNTELFPASPNVWDSLGEIYLERGEYQRAAKAYRRAQAALEQIPPSNRRFMEGNIQRNLAAAERGE